jgi:hypothetical protein
LVRYNRIEDSSGDLDVMVFISKSVEDIILLIIAQGTHIFSNIFNFSDSYINDSASARTVIFEMKALIVDK